MRSNQLSYEPLQDTNKAPRGAVLASQRLVAVFVFTVLVLIFSFHCRRHLLAILPRKNAGSPKGGDPAAGSPTATLLRLHPNHRTDRWRLSPLRVESPTSGPSNFRGVTGGVYKARERIHRGMLIRDY